MTKRTQQIILEIQQILESDSYSLGSVRGISHPEDSIGWEINNIENHISKFTALIHSIKEAAIIISNVSDNAVSEKELTVRFNVDSNSPLFIHLL